MPTYPEIQEHKAGDPVDLSNIQYPLSERFTSAFSNTYEHSQFNLIVNNRPQNVTPMEGYPGTFPTTEEDITKLKLDRPGLPNIPVGIPKYLGLAVASMYDNDKSLSLMEEAKPSLLGRIAAFGGAAGASVLDIKALITSIATGGVGGKVADTIGKMGMMKLGASEIFGAKAANIGTQMVQSGVTFGAANVGYQASRELQEAQSRDILQQPQQYVQSLQNMGIAGAQGILLGALGKGLGIAFFGRKVMRFEDGSFIDMPAEGKGGTYTPPEGESFPQFQHLEGQPWKADKEGGLFNRSEFNGMTPEQKQTVADGYKPWTPDADITMTEEATGQMMNGQVVNVDPIMKQGIADAGENFRQVLRDGNIDPEMLEGVLSDAHENIKTDLAEAIKQSEELRKSTKALEATEELPVIESKDMSQQGILRRAELAQFEESIMKQSPELVPENVRKFIEVQKEIQRLTEKAERERKQQPTETVVKSELGANDVTRVPAEVNKKVAQRIAALKKRLPKILRPKAELKALKRQLLKDAGTEAYGKGEAYHRLAELAKVWNSAKALKDNLDLHHNFENKIGELASHDFLINGMRDHINNAHEGASHADVRDYAEQLQSTGIPDITDTASEFEPKAERDIDAYMREYEPEEIRSIIEKVGDDAYNKEIERASDKVKNIPKMREMTKNMTDCLMKGAE